MLSIVAGHDVGYLTGPVAGGREGYYTAATAAGEPAGQWYGAGAAALGLTGEVDHDLIEAVYMHLLDPRDENAHNRATWGDAAQLGNKHRAYRTPKQIHRELLAKEPHATPERRAELLAQAERGSRQAVAFFDATFSAPKSVSVLGAAFERAENDALAAGDLEAAKAWGTARRAVEEAVMAGSRAALDHLAATAGYSRVGKHGVGTAGRWIDTNGLIVAQFLQHDSRDRDPQLHVHAAILNRVQCADGSWRTIDGALLFQERGAAGAIGERVMESWLSRTLGVTFAMRPDGKAREIVGVPQSVMDLFSSRRHAVTAKSAELTAAFVTRFGREPSALERTRIAQQATLATRAAKAHDGETNAQRLDRWEMECRALVAEGLASVAHDVVSLQGQEPPAAQTWSPTDVIERALADVAGKKQTWTRSDLTRAVSNALPGVLGLDPERIPDLLGRLTDEALKAAISVTPLADLGRQPREFRLRSGADSFVRPGAAKFTAVGQLRAERELRAAAVARGADALSTAAAAVALARFASAGIELGVDQATALRGILTSGAKVEVLAAPAGTGKSFVVGTLADVWAEHGRTVIGLAPSQVAASRLVEEGVAAANIDRWLLAQRRLEKGKPIDDDDEMRIRPGTIVVVDEAGMASTAQILAIQRRVEAAGGKLLLVGDPQQLGSIGAGGSLSDLADRAITYELVEVRRFTAEWEREASLRLREGDVTVLDEYLRHGRIIDAGTAEQASASAQRAWLADTLAGRTSLLLVGSNDEAALMNQALRAQLVELGLVEAGGVELGREGTVAGVGDVVQARRNGWDHIGVDGNEQAPINRVAYRVEEVRGDGGLVVSVVGDEHAAKLALSPQYVAEQLTLGYASTVHSAQGRTVDTAHSVVGSGVDLAALYVELTRGRDGNTAHVVTRPVAADLPTGATFDVEPRTGRAVIADIMGRTSTDIAAQQQIVEAEDEVRSTGRNAGQLIEGIAVLTGGKTASALDHIVAAGTLEEHHRRALAADDSMSAVDRLLRSAELAGYDREQLLAEAVDGRTLDGARSAAQVLYGRIRAKVEEKLTPVKLDSFADLIPAGVADRVRPWLEDRAERADERRRALGERVADARPEWAVDALGEVPDDVFARAEWEQKAGWAAAYREMAGHDDEVDALGMAPPAGLAEKYAIWRTAHAALALPDGAADEREMSDGQLRARVAAYERERAWAPAWVDDELSEAHQAAAQARGNATIWAAQAKARAAEDAAEAAKLAAAAAEEQARAQEMEYVAARLAETDKARAQWFRHTAGTLELAERSRAELEMRGVSVTAPPDATTGDEWLAEHEAAMAAEDEHRTVYESDVSVDEEAAEVVAAAEELLETDVADIRDTAAEHPKERSDRKPVPASARQPAGARMAEVVADVNRAFEVLREIEARERADMERQLEETHRAALAAYRWDDEDVDEDVDVHEGA